MAVLIESCEKTKSGKAWRVKASGIYYNAFLDSGIENHVGKMIEAEIHTHEKFGPSIAAFKLVAAPQGVRAEETQRGSGATIPGPAVAAPTAPQYAEPAKPGTVAPYWLPMASNVVAHGIAAGIIKSPNDVRPWVRAVEMAVTTETDPIPF